MVRTRKDNSKRAIDPKYLCPGKHSDGRPCRRYRGEDTPHFGIGNCVAHGGANDKEVWAMAYDVSREEDITPWEALLLSVRRAAGRVSWVDEQLVTATKQNDGNESAADIRYWLKESRDERQLMARMAKAAIDAGVSERIVRQVELEGQLVAEALAHALDVLDLPHEQRMIALTAAHDRLMYGEKAAIEGSVVDSTEDVKSDELPRYDYPDKNDEDDERPM